MRRPSRLRMMAYAVVALPLGALFWRIGDTFIEDDNFRVVTEKLFRAGQLRSDEWRESIQEHPYRSVLNLRGANKGTPWYKLETAFTAWHALPHFDYALSANVAPSLDQMRELVALMRAAPKPLLVHCRDGADRSGLASALYLYAIDGVPPEEASKQLSLWYGHYPWPPSRTGAMDKAFADFVAATPSS